MAFTTAHLALLELLPLAVSVLAAGVLDDRDGSIQYQSHWELESQPGAYLNTTTFTTTVGDTALVPFIGTQIAAYGVIVPTTVACPVINAAFVIDGNQSAAKTFNYDLVEPVMQLNVLYYVSPALSDGNHSLLVTNGGNCFWLDSFKILGADSTDASQSSAVSQSLAVSQSPTQSSSTLSSTAPRSSSLHQFTSSTLSTSFPAPTASSASQGTITHLATDNATSRRNGVGAIVGGVVGGLVVLLIVIFTMLLYRHRRLRENVIPVGSGVLDKVEDSSIRELDAGGIIGVTPYLLPRNYNESSASVAAPEVAGPLSPSVSGAPRIPHANNKSRLRQGPSAGGCGQRPPSSVSTVARSSHDSTIAATQGAVVSSEVDNDSDETNGPHSRMPPARSAKQLRSPEAVSPPPQSSSAPHPQAGEHEDSGLRFPRGEMPTSELEEIMYRMISESPPAYTTR
ncbi:hypothetical protein NM688_g1870 [Phlebia brevispora]|uniref:Uncharacterized protein n=1 Tax=Phlebia brevispora TaxID=194682 RepID=A0ACC1TAX2_9APHY|nr:hypothetical protein NM688_g1870 [Phlebia brevispora]